MTLTDTDLANRSLPEASRCTRLADYLDTTDEAEALPDELRRHLDGCADCRLFLDASKTVEAYLNRIRSISAAPPPGAVEKLRRILREMEEAEATDPPPSDE